MQGRASKEQEVDVLFTKQVADASSTSASAADEAVRHRREIKVLIDETKESYDRSQVFVTFAALHVCRSLSAWLGTFSSVASSLPHYVPEHGSGSSGLRKQLPSR
jgi:hypothetical protein